MYRIGNSGVGDGVCFKIRSLIGPNKKELNIVIWPKNAEFLIRLFPVG